MLLTDVIAYASLTGVLTGCTGLGGFLIMPILEHSAGLAPREAMATAMFSFLLPAGVGTMLAWRLHGFSRSGLLIATGALVAGFAGAQLSAWVPAAMLKLLLGLLLAIAALHGVRTRPASSVGQDSGDGPGPARLLGIGLISGTLSGMTGVGGPVVAIPLLSMARVSWGLILGSAQMLTLVTALSASLRNAGQTGIDYQLGLLVGCSQLLGMCLGLWLAQRLAYGRHGVVMTSILNLLAASYFLREGIAGFG